MPSWLPSHTHHGLVVNLLAYELVLAQRVACFAGDGIYRAFLHLLLDGTEKHEQGFSGTFLRGRRGRLIGSNRRKLLQDGGGLDLEI